MSKYRKIDVRIWNDAKFRDLSHNAKLVFFFLLTHPNMTALGAMRSTLSGLAEELDFDLEAFREAFREAFAKGMVKHDSKACLIALPNFIKYNQPESPNVVKAWANSLDLLPECDLKNDVISLSANALKGYSKAFREALPEAFLKTYPKSMPNQEQEQEQEQELNTNNTRASFEKIETQGEYVAKPVRELFNMTLDWKPNQQTFAAITMRNGLSAEYSDDRLAGFVSYWQAEPVELTQGQWENKFATYLKRPVLAPKEPKPKASPRNQQPQHDEYIPPPLYVPKPKVENPATREQIKVIMDEMRRKIAGGE
jgi:hypothetical protein